MVSHQSDTSIGAGNSSCLVSFPGKFIKRLPQCALQHSLAHYSAVLQYHESGQRRTYIHCSVTPSGRDESGARCRRLLAAIHELTAVKPV